ncbi:MAG: Mechanosensitive channel MscK [Chlamydiae bacterium]|nr:Mechanosensitive channel MscK [Chlamydiota bacterium]
MPPYGTQYLRRFLLFPLFCFVFLNSLSFAQNLTDAKQIEPSDLPSTWWELFQVEDEDFEKTASTFTKKLEQIPETLSEQNQEQGRVLVDDIKRNFQTYIRIIEQPLPQAKPPSTLAKSYSIANLIERNNRLQKNTIGIQASKAAQADLLKQLEKDQTRLDLVRQEYEIAEKRSEEKVLLGLEKISLRAAVESSIRKLALLKKTIKIESQSLLYLTEEIETAKERLVSGPFELTQFARQINPAKRVWDDSKRQREAIEARAASLRSEEQTREAETKNQNLILQVIEASLKEVDAQNDFISAETIYDLARLVNEPTEVSYDQLNQSVKAWTTQLTKIKQQLTGWLEQSQRIVQRAAQLISLEDTEDAVRVDKERSLLQENIEIGQKSLSLISGLRKELEGSLFLLSVVDKKTATLQGQRERWLRISADFFFDTLSNAREMFGKTLFHIGTHPITIVGVFQFFVILLIAWWISRLITRTLNTLAKRRKGIRKSVVYRLNRLLHYVILVIGLLVALTTIGFDFSNLVILAGALGVGLGFGLQNIFNNFISGIIILFQGQLKVGDYIELDNETRGEIQEISVRSTIITTNDGLEVLIPNSEMISKRIVNWTLRDPYRRVHIPFSVAYGSDIDKVAKVVTDLANKMPSTLQKVGVREPQVYLTKFGDNGLEMDLVVWVSGKWTRRSLLTRSQYLWSIEKALRKHGFTIPFPQRDLHIDIPTQNQE